MSELVLIKQISFGVYRNGSLILEILLALNILIHFLRSLFGSLLSMFDRSLLVSFSMNHTLSAGEYVLLLLRIDHKRRHITRRRLIIRARQYKWSNGAILFYRSFLCFGYGAWTLFMLQKLHLRRNKITNLDDELQELPELEYLNLRHNSIETLDNAFKVFQWPKLTDLNIINNPCD